MNLKNILMRGATAAAFVQVLLLAGQAWAEPAALPKVFTFATGYKLDAPAPHNIVELGVIKPCGDAMCLDIERYDSAKMLPRIPTKFKHEMHAPYGGATCFDGPVETVRGTAEHEKVYLHGGASGFSVVTHRYLYRWTIDDKAPGGYRIAEITPAGSSSALPQAVGFGFASASELKGDLTQAQLASYYKGEIYHKIAATGAEGDWTYAPSTIDFRVYKHGENGDVLIQSRPGDPSINKKYGRPMWVQSTVVLARGEGTIAPLIQEYGHDFNMDGCFDEAGHDKRMLPVGDENVRALVYIEYNADFERGFPILSVGRYYR